MDNKSTCCRKNHEGTHYHCSTHTLCIIDFHSHSNRHRHLHPQSCFVLPGICRWLEQPCKGHPGCSGLICFLLHVCILLPAFFAKPHKLCSWNWIVYFWGGGRTECRRPPAVLLSKTTDPPLPKLFPFPLWSSVSQSSSLVAYRLSDC